MTDAQPVSHSVDTMDSGQLAYLTAHLPSFSHHIVRASTARAYHELEHGPAVCKNAVLVTAERQRFAVFSARHMMLPGYHLLVRKERLAALAPAMVKGDVDLDKLGALAAVTGGYTRLRHYDGPIPDFVQAHDGAAVTGVTANALLFNLLQAERIDYAFVLPMDVYFYIEAAERQKFSLLPIRGAVRLAEAGVACSSDPSGQEVIRAVDALLADDQHWAEFLEPLRDWMPAETFASMLKAGRPSNMDRVP